MLLKPENRLEIHSADFLSDDSSDVLFNNSLSDIDNQDFVHLQSEIQNLSARFYEKNPLESEDDITSIDLIQLWSDAYANKKDPVNDIIISIQQNLRQHPIFRKLRILMSDCKFRDNRLYYRDHLYIPDSNEL